MLCRRSTGTACLIVPLVSFARLTLPIMRDNTGNRLSRYPITGPDHCTFTESVLSQMLARMCMRIGVSPFVHRLMPLCRTKGTDILIAVECALQRQIVRKRGFLFSRYERICFVIRKGEKLGYFLCRFTENFFFSLR